MFILGLGQKCSNPIFLSKNGRFLYMKFVEMILILSKNKSASNKGTSSSGKGQIVG